MKITQFTLKNGLNVFLVPQKEASSVAVELVIRAGSKHEKKGNYGLAHFLEHMAFKGTEKWPSAKKLAKALDQIGAVYNASTGKGRTAYWIRVAPQHLKLVLEVISQMLTRALLKQEEIGIERGVIIEELNMYEDRPMDKVGDLFEEQLFGNNPLGRPIIGKKEDILSVKAKDFISFKKEWYRAPQMSLAIVGAILDLTKTKEAVKRYYSRIRGGKKEKVLITPQPKKEEIFWKKQKTEQTHFILGLPSVTVTDERKWPLGVLVAILGVGMSSRLWESIREKRGWAYYVYSFQGYNLSSGYLGAVAGVKNEVAKQAIDLVKKEFIKIKKNLKKEEFNRANSMLDGRFLISIESPLKIAGMLNNGWLTQGKVITPEYVLKKGREITFAQVKKTAQEFIDLKNLRGAVIGPSGK